MTDLVNQFSVLEVPRGDLNNPSLKLDMNKLYVAEGRISETRVSNPATAAELTSVFNDACNTTTKYIAWIKYEILRAKRNFDLAKATVIIDRLPDEIMKLKAAGMKDNSDFRAALIDRDPNCMMARDILDTLEAAKTFLESKVKSFERAYWDSKETAKNGMSNPATPNLSVAAGPSSYNLGQSLDHSTQPETHKAKSFIGTSKF